MSHPSHPGGSRIELCRPVYRVGQSFDDAASAVDVRVTTTATSARPRSRQAGAVWLIPIGLCDFRGGLHTAGGIAYWNVHQPGNSLELYAYLAVMPEHLGSLAILEGKQGWTDPAWRRRPRLAPTQSCCAGGFVAQRRRWHDWHGFRAMEVGGGIYA